MTEPAMAAARARRPGRWETVPPYFFATVTMKDRFLYTRSTS